VRGERRGEERDRERRGEEVQKVVGNSQISYEGSPPCVKHYINENKKEERGE
jgi:hypothetical protein